MCLKQIHTFKVPDEIDNALWSILPGWLVTFNRRGNTWRTAIYIGIGLLSQSENCETFVAPQLEAKGSNSPFSHLICCLPKSSFKRKEVILVEDFKTIAKNADSIQVFECHCSKSMRMSAIDACLMHLGKAQVNSTEHTLHFSSPRKQKISVSMHMARIREALLKFFSLGLSCGESEASLPSDMYIFLLENTADWVNALTDENCRQSLSGFAKALHMSPKYETASGFETFLNWIVGLSDRDNGREASGTVLTATAAKYLSSFSSARILPQQTAGGEQRFEKLTLRDQRLQGLESVFDQLLNCSDIRDTTVPTRAATTQATTMALDYYPVTSPQGFCLVININNYDASTGLSCRTGSEHDVAHIKDVFERLDFIVQVENDLWSDEIDNVLTKLAHDERLANHGCLVIFLMAHGTKQTIIGRNGKPISLDRITETFKSNLCPALSGKPKIMVIQACRGLRQEFYRAQAMIDGPSDNEESSRYSPNDADFLLCFACSKDYSAYRTESAGSYFVHTLCREIENNYRTEHIVDILTRVTNVVSRTPVPAGWGEVRTVPEFTSSLTKKYYLRK